MLLAPNANDVLTDVRRRYFRNIARRMTAHVTLLFPFRSPIDDDTLDEIAAVSGRLEPFEATFRDVGRFRDDVVWLRPHPVERFAVASDAVLAAFADCTPYAGAHRGRTLHLTVASALRGNEASRLESELAALEPITDWIDELSLMIETGSGWRRERAFPLGFRPIRRQPRR